jgi:hypothetical protein
MSKFVEAAMTIAHHAGNTRNAFARGEILADLRAHLERREAVTAALLEALEKQIAPFNGDAIDKIYDEYGSGTAERIHAGRAALALAKEQE